MHQTFKPAFKSKELREVHHFTSENFQDVAQSNAGASSGFFFLI